MVLLGDLSSHVDARRREDAYQHPNHFVRSVRSSHETRVPGTRPVDPGRQEAAGRSAPSKAGGCRLVAVASVEAMELAGTAHLG